MMGIGSTTKLVKIRFTVVNAPSSYNVILVGLLVGVIRIDQHVTRKCYDESTQVMDGHQGACTRKEEARVYHLEMDPRFDQEDAHACPDEDLKEV
ncbi:hypothetical protein CR513_33028, partial [Mucuna pruriens]